MGGTLGASWKRTYKMLTEEDSSKYVRLWHRGRTYGYAARQTWDLKLRDLENGIGRKMRHTPHLAV